MAAMVHMIVAFAPVFMGMAARLRFRLVVVVMAVMGMGFGLHGRIAMGRLRPSFEK